MSILPLCIHFSTVYQDEPFQTYFKINNNRCSIKYIEHVVVRATFRISVDDQYQYPDYYSEDYVDENPFIIFFNGPRRGAISVKLKSPHGTVSHLLPRREHDFVNTDGYDHWPFTSVQHWSETPNGYWNFSVHFGASGGHVIMRNLSMTVYGTTDVPKAIKQMPSQCDQSCAGGCALAGGSVYCDKCQSLRMADTLTCVSSCPIEYCTVAGYCQKCPRLAIITSSVVVSTVAVAAIATTIVIGVICYMKWSRRNREMYTKL